MDKNEFKKKVANITREFYENQNGTPPEISDVILFFAVQIVELKEKQRLILETIKKELSNNT